MDPIPTKPSPAVRLAAWRPTRTRTCSSAGQTWLVKARWIARAAAAPSADLEDAEELVAAGVDLATARAFDGAPLQLASRQARGVSPAESVGKSARVLDVAEEEGRRHAAFPTVARPPVRRGAPRARARPDRAGCRREPTVQRLDAVAQAAEAGSTLEIGAADAVVLDSSSTRPLKRSAQP